MCFSFFLSNKILKSIKLVNVSIYTRLSKNLNCQTDFDTILLQLTSIVKVDTTSGEVPAVTLHVHCSDAGSVFEAMKSNSSCVQDMALILEGNCHAKER